MLKKIIWIIGVIFSCIMYGQEPLHYFLGKDVFNGVQLYSIIEDTDHTMWITSNKGVYHYDGVSITPISTEESSRDAFFGLIKDNNDDVFCFNFSGEIFKIVDKKLILFYTIPTEFLGNGISINFDNRNNLIIHLSARILTLSTKTKKIISDQKRGAFSYKKEDTLYYGKEIDENRVAIVGLLDGVETPYQTLDTAEKHIGSPLFYNLYFHKNQLYAFSPSTSQLYSIVNNSIKKIPLSIPKDNHYGSYYSNGNFWFTTTKNGVYKLAIEDVKLENTIEKWFENYTISGVYNDFENNTWLLTFNSGIIIMPNLNVSTFKIQNDRIAGIKKIDDEIYISTHKNKILKFQNEKFNPLVEMANDRLESFNVYKDKDIVTSSTSIYKGERVLKDIITFNRGTVLVDDSIYVAMHTGFYKFDIKKEKLSILKGGRTHNLVLSPQKDKIYVASISGLFLYDFKQIKNITFSENVQPRKLIFVGNQLWVTSKKGIHIIEGDKVVKQLTTQDGLLSDNIDNIEYEYPYVYIINGKGFQQYNIKSQTFNNLVEDYGLSRTIQDWEVLRDTIYATTPNGLLKFSFNDTKTKMVSYPTVITEALINGSKALVDATSLRPNENNLSFSFMTTSYRYQKKLDYYYQLIGYDSQPIKAKNGQYIVNYSNLPAGDYIFKVYSAIHGQRNGSANILFSIQQHWYSSIWFKIFALSTLIMLLYGIYANRMKVIRRKRKEEQLAKQLAESSLTSLKAQMNPHFMFNAMNSVQSFILKDKKDEAYNYLTKLSKLIRNTLDMSDKTWVYLDEEIEQITNYLELEKLRFNHDFNYEITSEEKIYGIRIPSMIIQPFVENSVKHGLLHKESGDKQIKIIFKLQLESLICIIEDNGVGREISGEINQQKPDYKKAFSTNAIHQRFKLYKHHLNKNVGFEYTDLFQDNKPTGTLVTITIPYKTDES